MCGIAAILASNKDIPPHIIRNMTDCLRHRGPDAEGLQLMPGCHLGHRRLSVIDLVTGDQPMCDERNRYWIIFNGEIYNYREVRQELVTRGCKFRTQSDTEVILQAYLVYGDQTPLYLNGQFVFAIWDTVERRLFVARDRLGEKPLYWTQTPEGYFLLASEIKALLASGLVAPRLDLTSVDAYLALLYVPPDRTIYENIHTLSPGSAFNWTEGRYWEWKYWHPMYSTQEEIDPQEAVEQIRALIEQAVDRQMVADVPVGAFLSGGLNSATIVALMTRHTNHPVKTFSVGFGDLINELPYARAVADQYHTEHHEIQMDIPVGAMLERMAEVYDEPIADSSNIPMYLISEFTRREVTVALSGDGGDELFGGYDWYKNLHAGPPPSTLQMGLLRMALSVNWRLMKAGLISKEEFEALGRRYKQGQYERKHSDLWIRHLIGTTNVRTSREKWWGKNIWQSTEEAIRQVYTPESSVQGMDRAVDFDLRCYLPGDILVKVDRATLAHGLESRAPFLDVDLVEFVLSLPWKMRFAGDRLKPLLRVSCADLWPTSVSTRSKQGFGAPISSWIQRADVQTLLSRVTLPSGPLESLLPGIQSELSKLTAQDTWSLLSLGLWLERRTNCLP